MFLREVEDNQPVRSSQQAKVICEIPIYGTSQDKFNEYWDEQANKYIRECIAISPGRKDVSCLRESFLNGVMWKYNQIVGFIRISLNRTDVNFEEFMSFCRYRRNSKSRPLIQFNSDFHFYIGNKSSNAEIVHEIKEYMQLFIEEKLKSHPNYYFDISTFSNIIDCLDLSSIINEVEDIAFQ